QAGGARRAGGRRLHQRAEVRRHRTHGLNPSESAAVSQEELRSRKIFRKIAGAPKRSSRAISLSVCGGLQTRVDLIKCSQWVLPGRGATLCGDSVERSVAALHHAGGTASGSGAGESSARNLRTPEGRQQIPLPAERVAVGCLLDLDDRVTIFALQGIDSLYRARRRHLEDRARNRAVEVAIRSLNEGVAGKLKCSECGEDGEGAAGGH